MKLIEFNALKNDVLDILTRQNKITPGIGRELVAIFNDPQTDDMWRTYVLQYMGPYLRGMAKLPEEEALEMMTADEITEEKQQIMNTLFRALEETEGSVSGTSLLALEELSEEFEEFDRNRVGEEAVNLVLDGNVSESTLITSLRICGMMGRTEVLETTRLLAQTAESITTRQAAIATLGEIGSPDDLDLLSALTSETEERIRLVAEHAHDRLKNE